MEPEILLQIDDQTQGPFTVAQVREMWQTYQVSGKTLCLVPGSEWMPLTSIRSQILGSTPFEGPQNSPAAPKKFRVTADSKFHLDIGGDTKGPLTITQVRSMWNRADITGETIYFVEGMADWKPLSEIVALIENSVPPVVESEPSIALQTASYHGFKKAIQDEQQRRAKSKTSYQILALLFCALGIHNFYAGRWWQGIAQLLLTLTAYGAIISVAWALAEVFIVTEDGNGVPFR